MTEPEKILWKYIRNKQFFNLRFRRQYSVWRYILDFYCPWIKLCIEIDWDNHVTQKDYDNIRTEFLNTLWIKVIRYNNLDIINNIEWVLENLENKIKICK
jgi:very-short-patch-repair endonuclease